MQKKKKHEQLPRSEMKQEKDASSAKGEKVTIKASCHENSKVYVFLQISTGAFAFCMT